MHTQLRDTYQRLAEGTGELPQIEGLDRDLLYICFEEAGHELPENRSRALTVAAHLPPKDAMRIADPLLNDPEVAIRRQALDLAIAAKQDGISTLRGAVNCHDTDIAVAALARLVTQLDPACTLHARQWIRNPEPRIRAGAARLLGNIAGPAMAVVLGRTAESDPVAAVRAIAVGAARRCTGEQPKRAPQNHWEAGPADLSLPEPMPEATPEPPPRNDGLETLYPTEEPDDAAPVHALVPAAAPDEQETVIDTPRDWRDASPLPSSMPTSPSAILKLMGMVAQPDRVHVLTAWMQVEKSAQSSALGSWSPGSDATLGRGIAIALALLKEGRYASMLRHMLVDSHPGVRAAAAEALGVTGTLSMIPPLAQVLNAPEPEVREAGVKALAAMLTKRERYRMLRERLTPLANDPDSRVQTAVKQALDAIP